MLKDRLYILTFVSMGVLFLITAAITSGFIIDATAQVLIENQMEASKREAREMAEMIGYQMENGISREQVVSQVQNSIENSHTENAFLCVFDWSGKEVCHPDVTRVGQKVSPNQSIVTTINGEAAKNDFYKLIQNRKPAGGIRDFRDEESLSEIVYLHPVANSDWIVGAHANINRFSTQLSELRKRFYTYFVLMGLVLVSLSVLAVRWINSTYEVRLEKRNQTLESEVINLAKLNKDLHRYQEKIEVSQEEVRSETLGKEEEIIMEEGNTAPKKRILTYKRNELLPVSIDEIAYIYTENSITYVISSDGRKSTSNSSLDELFANLDESLFYRANRQFIVAISAIETILRYGNNQLRIKVEPESELEIVISKNKAAEFKQWLSL